LARVSHADSASGDSDVTSDEDTKKSFDFTGEIRMLNESGASGRQSFVEQLESAFKTPARIDLRYTFPDNVMDAPPIPALPIDIQDPSTSSVRLSAIADDFTVDDMGESHDTILSDDEEYCRRLSLPMDSPSISIVRERPGNPLASSRNSRPSDGQLNRSFRFGGSPMPSQRSDNSYSQEVSEAPLTLSDIIPPPSHHSRGNSRDSSVEEDSSVLKSIMAHANTVLPVASEVAVPRVRPRIESNDSINDIVGELSRISATSRVSGQGQSRISFVGLDSFDEVRRGFEFGPNRPAFYPPVSFSREHNKHDSVFSIASVSSYGSVVNNGAPDPFGYSRHSRPPSEDMSISMSMTVDDTFSFMYQKRRSRVDSDASSFYFRSQPSMMGPIRRGHKTHDSIISAGGAPPVSLYNRSNHGHSHRRGDSSGSVSSVALSYALHGANGGRATWAKHTRNDPSIDSTMSDYSVMRLSRPGLGDKMFDHGAPLSAISASPNQSFDSGLYDQYQERTDFDSIMDTRRSITQDSLMDYSSERISGTDSVFFENSRISSNYSVQSHFRPVSIISIDSSHHAPREDDTMISVGIRIFILSDV
jgi:serine/arginine repetitive matrix protein 2